MDAVSATRCPGCGRTVSNQLITCPGCGTPIGYRRSDELLIGRSEQLRDDGPEFLSVRKLLAGSVMLMAPALVAWLYAAQVLSEGEMWAALFFVVSHDSGENGSWFLGFAAYVGALGLATFMQELALGFGLIGRRWADFTGVAAAMAAVTGAVPHGDGFDSRDD